MVLGLAAGLLATTATQPFDLVKTRLQVRPDVYPRTSTAIRHIFKVSILSNYSYRSILFISLYSKKVYWDFLMVY
jgi:hypothetical protein